MSDDQSLFDATDITPVIDPNRDYLTDLVGDDKKYKSPAELAKAAVFKDAHILRLETEAAERKTETDRLRNELSTRARLEDLVDNIASRDSKTPSNDELTRLREPVPSSPVLTPAQLETQIDDLLNKRDKERTGKTNRDFVKQKLAETYGPNYQNKVREQGRTLGLGEGFLNSLASENPTAFFKLIGIEDKPQRSIFTPPQSEVNSDAHTFSPSVTTRGKAFYDKLRVEKGDRHYWSPQVQTQMHKDALADPAAFGLTGS